MFEKWNQNFAIGRPLQRNNFFNNSYSLWYLDGEWIWRDSYVRQDQYELFKKWNQNFAIGRPLQRQNFFSKTVYPLTLPPRKENEFEDRVVWDELDINCLRSETKILP